MRDNNKKKSISLASLLKRGISLGLISVAGVSCDFGSSFVCPDTQDTLRTGYSFGSRGLGPLGLGDEDNHGLGACNFEIYDEHEGGTGDTLEWVNWTDSIYMSWAYNSLSDVSVGPNYKGQTDTGLKIGDDFDLFMQLYPNAVQSSFNDYSWGDNGFSVYFDKDNKIKSMRIDRSDPGNEFIFPPFFDGNKGEE